jgi:hypothetical protein
LICKKKDNNTPNTTPTTNIQNNQTNNNTTNNIQQINNNNQKQIIINQIGKETISCLPMKDIFKILTSNSNMPITCIKKLNFNKDFPENHSFCTSTLEGKHFTRINHKTQKPEKINKIEFIDEVLNSAFKAIYELSLLAEIDKEYNQQIPIEYQNKMQDIINNKAKFCDPRIKKIFFNCINDMSYNFKDMIQETWKLVQPPEIEDIETDSEGPPLIDEEQYKNYVSETDSDDD